MAQRRWFGLALLALSAACGGTVIGEGGPDGGADARDGTITQGPDVGSGPVDAPTPEEAAPIPDAKWVDRGGPLDAGPGGIPCGSETCFPETQECCVSLKGTFTCSAKGACDGGVTVMCSGPASCTGKDDVCCASFGGGLPEVSCTTAASCMGRIVCMSTMDCPMGETCEPSGFPGYSICGHGRPDGGFHRPDGGFHRPDGSAPPDGGSTPDAGTPPKDASTPRDAGGIG